MVRKPIALITGATRGIGAATARALSASHTVLLGGRDEIALKDLAEQLPDAQPWPADLSDGASLAAALPRLTELDVLAHCAGACEIGALEDTSPASWQSLFQVNVFAVAELTRLALPALRAARGRVIVINSTAGLGTQSGRGAYTASKYALRAFTETLHREELATGVRVTSLYPGRVATDMQREIRRAEGGLYEPEHYLDPDSVASAVMTVVAAPPDAHITELTVKPRFPPAQST